MAVIVLYSLFIIMSVLCIKSIMTVRAETEDQSKKDQ